MKSLRQIIRESILCPTSRPCDTCYSTAAVMIRRYYTLTPKKKRRKK